jgi:hypothetical protein
MVEIPHLPFARGIKSTLASFHSAKEPGQTRANRVGHWDGVEDLSVARIGEESGPR